jgi:hypothetical protein
VYGIVEVCWSPDSRHILTIAEFHVSQPKQRIKSGYAYNLYLFYLFHGILCLTYSNVSLHFIIREIHMMRK